MFEFVDLATAREHKGVRIAVQGTAPSPWSEATKGLFRIAGLPIVATSAIQPCWSPPWPLAPSRSRTPAWRQPSSRNWNGRSSRSKWR